MGEYKKQHFVPRAYLRSFLIPGKEQIYVYDKEVDKVRINNIYDVAEQNYFYDIDLNGLFDGKNAILHESDGTAQSLSDPHFLEKRMSETVEPAFLSIIRNIIARYNIATEKEFAQGYFIDDNVKRELSYCLAIQYYRIPKMRKAIRQISKQTRDFADQLFPDELHDDIELSKDEAKHSHILGLLDTESISEVAHAFYDLTWMLGINKTKTLFYTSDAPIVPIPHSDNGARGNRGLRSYGVEVIFPLTPKLILIMTEPRYHSIWIPFEKKYIQCNNKGIIELYNWHIAKWAERCVFSQNGDYDIIMRG